MLLSLIRNVTRKYDLLSDHQMVLHDIITGINEITIVDLRESADQCIVTRKGNSMKF